jgi:RNA polymerase sigma-70 factor (ECF subfamily)
VPLDAVQLTDADATALRAGVRMLALRALGDAEAADEVAQETLVRAVAALGAGRLSDPTKLGAFVAAIARHVIADVQRERHRLVALDSVPDPPTGQSDPLATLIVATERARVRATLAELSPADRELLRLSFHEGLAPGEIAVRLGEPADRIRKRKSRARERARLALLAAGGHDTDAPPTTTEEQQRRLREGT